jgi:hypothetical protein
MFVIWDITGWDGMGWDGMGWDGMGWDGMGWDGGGVICFYIVFYGIYCDGIGGG